MSNNNGCELPDLEKQQCDSGAEAVSSIPDSGVEDTVPAVPLLNVVISEPPTSTSNLSKEAPSPQKGNHSRTSSSYEQCRVCQQDKDEALIDLGCHCRGGLAKAHRSCIDTWFRTKGSNKCEICQGVAANVSSPESQPTTNYWVWRIETTFRSQNQDRGCMSPLWVAFSILIGGLLLDVLISATLGISAVPVNIIIGVIVVLGLGTILRLALSFCHEWSSRRVVQRMRTNVQNVPIAYHTGF